MSFLVSPALSDAFLAASASFGIFSPMVAPFLVAADTSQFSSDSIPRNFSFFNQDPSHLIQLNFDGFRVRPSVLIRPIRPVMSRSSNESAPTTPSSRYSTPSLFARESFNIRFVMVGLNAQPCGRPLVIVL